MNKNLLLTIAFVCISLISMKAQTILFSEDFHNGIPVGWGNSGTSNGSPNNWVKWRTTTAGAHGAFSPAYGNVSSPTAANGVAIFDSDSLDNGGHTLPSGQPDPTRGPANAPHHCELTTPAIGVAGHQYLRLTFYQMLASYQATTYVGISTDSISWMYDTINMTVTTNNTTQTRDQKLSLDISNMVGGQPKVYLRFVFDGNYYDWQIDDITVMDLPANDLAVKTSQGSFGTSSFNLFYSSIPLSQSGPASADSFYVVTTYSNVGSTIQPNCQANIEEIKNQTVVGSGTTPQVNLAYGIDTPVYRRFALTGLGSYKMAINISSDSADFDPSNNTDTISFVVTDTIYSINSSRKNNTSAYYLIRANAGMTYRMGNLFEVTHTDTITSITTAVEGGTTGTHAGAVIRASIYQVTDTFIGPNETLYYNSPTVSTFTKTLTTSNITASTAATVTPFSIPIDNSTGNPVLSPGLYWVAVEGVSPAPGDSNVLIATTPFQNGGFPLVETNNTLSYLSFTDAPYCNMNFGHSSSLLYASFVWGPVVPYTNTSITFNANNTNASPSATYRWEIAGLNTGFTDTRYGKIMRDTFNVSDTFYVCLTVTEGNDSVQSCKMVHVRQNNAPTCSANFVVVADTTPHTYIATNYATGSNLVYLWHFGDGDSSTLPYPSHTYAAAGYYTLCLTVFDTVSGCTASYCDSNRYYAKTGGIVTLHVVRNNTGIANVSGTSPISIYPNPANDAFNIRVNSEMVGSTYILTDLTGREVATGHLKREITTVPVGDFSPGIYIIHLGAETFKLIKE